MEDYDDISELQDKIHECIETYQNELIKEYLDDFLLLNWSFDEMFEELYVQLILAYSVDNNEAVEIIIDIFGDHNDDQDVRPVISTFFRIYSREDLDFLLFVSKNHRLAEYPILFYSFLNYQEDKHSTNSFLLLEKIFEEQDIGFYIECKDYMDKKELDFMEIYKLINEKIQILQEYASAPIMESTGKTDKELKEICDDIVNNIPVVKNISRKKASRILFKDEKLFEGKFNKTHLERMNNIVAFLDLLDNNTFNMWTNDYIEKKQHISLAYNKDIIKTYGASHPRLNNTNSSFMDYESPCSLYGGCHMLLCEGHGMKSEIDEIERTSWFHGNCDYQECQKKIKYEHWAKRMPLPMGGWDGCYCSWEHVFLDNKLEDIMINIYTKIFERKSKKYIIYDRIYDTNYKNTIIEAEEGYFDRIAFS